jgi:putative membrane protein
MWFWHHGWTWMAGGFMLLFWAIVIVGIIFFVRWIARQGGTAGPRMKDEGALDILKKRYARGEINKEEFEQKKKDLSA